jgi:hypothetical protein
MIIVKRDSGLDPKNNTIFLLGELITAISIKLRRDKLKDSP